VQGVYGKNEQSTQTPWREAQCSCIGLRPVLHKRVDEGVTVGNCRMNRLLLRTNLYCMRGSSQQGLQHVF